VIHAGWRFLALVKLGLHKGKFDPTKYINLGLWRHLLDDNSMFGPEEKLMCQPMSTETYDSWADSLVVEICSSETIAAS
jgi:hypothetical protein